MPRFRSILSLCLVLVTTLLVSCGSPNVSKIPTTYSPEKIEQLQILIDPIKEARDNMANLKNFIAEENWTDTQTYLHGPLGSLRLNTANLTRSLLPKEQKAAREAAKELFSRFERIDEAAKERNAADAKAQFNQAIKDFNAFLDILPKS